MVCVGGDVLQKVGKNGIRHAGGRMSVIGHVVIHDAVDDVIKQFTAHFLQQAVLGFEMGVECASPYVGAVNNILDGNFGIRFF